MRKRRTFRYFPTANHFASLSGTKSTFATVLEYGASIIALVAIFKSFFGHYTGTLEGLNGPVLKFGYKGDKTKVSMGKLNTISMIFIMGSTGRSLRKPEHSGPD